MWLCIMSKERSDLRILNLIVSGEIPRTTHSQTPNHLSLIVRIINLTTIYIVKFRFGIATQVLVNTPIKYKRPVDDSASPKHFMSYVKFGRLKSISRLCFIV